LVEHNLNLPLKFGAWSVNFVRDGETEYLAYFMAAVLGLSACGEYSLREDL